MSRFTQITSSFLIAAQVLTVAAPAFAADKPDPLAALKIPAGAKVIAKGYVDDGVQRNECVLKNGGYVFEPRGPEARVKDRPGGRAIIFHTAEPGGLVSWTDLITGSIIIAKVKEFIPPKDGTQIPQVMLEVIAHLGPQKGPLSRTDIVVRPNPVGGGAAAKKNFTGPEFCNEKTVGQVKRSGYNTAYYFEENLREKLQTFRQKIEHTVSRARAAVTRRPKAPVTVPQRGAANDTQRQKAMDLAA